MTSDIFFRISFLLLWIALGILRVYYGRKTKTHNSLVGVAEKLKTAEQEMGKGMMVLTAIVTVIGGPGLILYLISPPWWVWTRLPLGELVKWLGIIIAIPPLFYLVWVHRHLDTQWSIALELQEDHKLITGGPYSRVRHPMYLGIFVYTTGLILIASDLLVFVFFAFSIWVNYRRIPSEEEMMIEQFGDKYREYMKQTGRLFPRISQDE
ncbi:MAG: isoprenylcysteine carboxylmethyltransferase family protein [Candidatus Thorarchaeota archaeon]